MTFSECLDYFNELSECKSFDDIKDDSYFQFNIIGKDEGVFYLHISDKRMIVTCGEYRKKDVQYIATLASLDRILNGLVEPIYAYTTGKIKIHGDVSLGRTFLSVISKK